MPRRIGMYDHINKESPLEITVDIEDLAKRIEAMNYGTHRLLSALVRIRRKDTETESFPECRMLTDGIEELLNRGGF